MTTTASQAVEAEVLIALQNMPTNVILVGDPQQLSSTVNRYAVYATCNTGSTPLIVLSCNKLAYLALLHEIILGSVAQWHAIT
jgi:AAA domain